MNDTVFTLLGASNHYGERQEDDFYATIPIAVEKLLDKFVELEISYPEAVIEPSVGNGNIIKTILKSPNWENIPNKCFDIVDRGYPGTIVRDFLSVERGDFLQGKNYIFANFPYKDITEHTVHSLNLLNDGEYLFSLAKIQFLEGKKRYENIFKENPPKYIMPFVERINCYKNNINTGAVSAMCYAWYVFEKGFNENPEIIWITGSNK